MTGFGLSQNAPKCIILRYHRFRQKMCISKSFTATLLNDLEGSLAGATTKTVPCTDDTQEKRKRRERSRLRKRSLMGKIIQGHGMILEGR
ncbi:hypothetical protein GRJ2_001981400 [Grus japonensis]|uniref:Uncharacterized protein n=1 Tax=Grus japonensis TaxID=30415 RepID=A0ABC9XBU8_GRUJA